MKIYKPHDSWQYSHYTD